jgi:LAGLIDADG endonuclease
VPANPTDQELSGHCIAGIIDAEAYFGISEMNGGGSFSCHMHLAVRDDDVGLLHAMAGTTGLGVVRRKDDRGNPQACWSVYRKADAVALASYLTRYPLRSRKRNDFEVWKHAVELWAGDAQGRRTKMRALAAEVREVRRYTPPDMTLTPSIDRNGFAAWFGGLVAGDGYLGINQGGVRLTVKLRADDAPVLAAIRATTGAGTVRGPYRNPAAHPSLAWNVCRTSELVDLARRLEGRVPGRKGLELEVWRQAVEARADRELSRERRRAIIDDAESRLRELRRYRPGAALPSPKSRRLQRMYEQNRSWIALLRRWAADEPGTLNAMDYNRWRPPGSPTRNTLARRFGSWYDALDAAGLADRAAVTPSERDARTRGGELRRAERRIAQRERTIAAVKRCAAALGHFPGPTEYARWRLHNGAEAPTFVTAYRIFDGGWSELRARCTSNAAVTTI